MRRAGLLAALACAGLWAAPAAHAGTYTIYACAAGNKVWDNRAWALETPLPAGVTNDSACPKAGQNIDLTTPAGATIADGAIASFAFRPAAGTRIVDFRINRRLIYNAPAVEGAHAPFTLIMFGDRVLEGAGNHPVAGSVGKRWYANPSDSRLAVMTRASFGAPAGAGSLIVQLGCWKRGTPCKVAAGGGVAYRLVGTAIEVEDPTSAAVTVAASGLLAGGQRDGSDPVAVEATDNSGIRRVELVDVTEPAAPAVVGVEEYDAARPGFTYTDRRASCSWRLRVPCPQLDNEAIRPTALQVGRRSLVVRVFDAAGNVTDRGPYPVDVVTPSDRGPVNGASEARISASMAGGRARRTVSQNGKVTVTGRLLTPGGAPVSGARIHVLSRDVHRDTFADRGTVTTGSDGTFRYRATAYASRLYQFGWRARERDARFAESAYVTIRARARASLRVPRSVRVGRSFTISGRLRGLVPGRAVAVVAQGRRGRGSWQTFEDGLTRGRSFKLRYRFRSPASRGRTFSIRVRLRPRGGWPYEDGRTRTVRIRVR